MFVKTTLEGTEAVLRSQPNAIENFVVCDLPGFADFADRLPAERRVIGKEGARWYGGMSYEQSLTAVRSGDPTGVAASDKLLRELEALVPVSKSCRTFNSVIGMCPNVPEYLAGNPYNMRLRRRCATATAPLSIFVELVASAGIDAKTCLKRGAAMLALVRMLANLRPVELWCVIAIGQRNSRSSLCVQLDTAPLDLARSAHVFTHPSVFRALSYKSLDHEFYGGSWNGDPALPASSLWWGFGGADDRKTEWRISWQNQQRSLRLPSPTGQFQRPSRWPRARRRRSRRLPRPGCLARPRRDQGAPAVRSPTSQIPAPSSRACCRCCERPQERRLRQ